MQKISKTTRLLIGAIIGLVLSGIIRKILGITNIGPVELFGGFKKAKKAAKNAGNNATDTIEDSHGPDCPCIISKLNSGGVTTATLTDIQNNCGLK